MADGSNSIADNLQLSAGEARDVAALVVARAQGRLLDASAQFHDIVLELEWRLRDYLHLTHHSMRLTKAVRAAEAIIHQRNAEGMRLHAEVLDLEARIVGLEKWLGVAPTPTALPTLTPDLVGLVFARLYGASLNASDVAEWPTLAAATLRIHARRIHKAQAGLAPNFNALGELE